jgi:hypothetical protein
VGIAEAFEGDDDGIIGNNRLNIGMVVPIELVSHWPVNP